MGVVSQVSGLSRRPDLETRHEAVDRRICRSKLEPSPENMSELNTLACQVVFEPDRDAQPRDPLTKRIHDAT